MGRFDRYMLGQLLRLFGFFGLVLVMIYWINRAVVLFDQLIADGQSASVFFEFTALSLPNLIRIVIPFAAFAAAAYVTNRMAGDSELTVVQATGYAPLRLARPVLMFGIVVAALMLVLTHLLVPLSNARLQDRQAEITQNMSARLLNAGTFTSPSSGVTLFIREVSPAGELLDLFLSDRRDPEQTQIYTASRAYLLRSQTGPQLILADGMAQTLDRGGDRLFLTKFDEFAYDIGALITPADRSKRSYREMPTRDLLRADSAIQQESGRSRARLLYEGHSRFNQALLGAVAGFIGFAPLLMGAFSRFGLWRQLLAAVFLVIVIMGLNGYAAELAQSGPQMWPLTYLASFVGTILALAILLMQQRRRRVGEVSA